MTFMEQFGPAIISFMGLIILALTKAGHGLFVRDVGDLKKRVEKQETKIAQLDKTVSGLRIRLTVTGRKEKKGASKKA